MKRKFTAFASAPSTTASSSVPTTSTRTASSTSGPKSTRIESQPKIKLESGNTSDFDVVEETNSTASRDTTNSHDIYDSRHEFIDESSKSSKSQMTSNQLPRSADLSWFQDTVINLPKELENNKDNVPRWIKAKDKLLKRQQELEKQLAESSFLDPSAPTDSQQQTSLGPVSLNEIVDTLKEHAAIDINVINVAHKVDHMDALVVCHGSSERHVYSIADSIRILVPPLIILFD